MAEAAEAAPTPNPFAPVSQNERAKAEPIHLAVPAEEWMPRVPAPAGVFPPSNPRFGRMGTATRSWVYQTEEGEIAFAVYRFDYQNDKGEPTKDIVPMTYGTKNGRVGWHWKAPPAPSALYRSPELVTDTAKTVLVVEGEKTADAAALLFPDMAVVTWQGGGNAVQKADWFGLTERTVLIWPDNDKAGRKAAERVGRITQEASAADVRIVRVPETWPEAWDLADALPGDATVDTLRALLGEAEPATQAAELPSGYSMNGRGMWFHPRPNRGNAGAPEPIFISAPFEIMAETKDEVGGSWGLLLRWVVQNWDDLLRLAGSLKLGTVQAAGLIRTLQTNDRPTRLARALEEWGRVVKSLYLLSYIDDEAYHYSCILVFRWQRCAMA